jgi:hypothetical protein
MIKTVLQMQRDIIACHKTIIEKLEKSGVDSTASKMEVLYLASLMNTELPDTMKSKLSTSMKYKMIN